MPDLRVAIMGRWKATCGISVHAELLARGLLELGCEVVVCAPTLESASSDWHHKWLGVVDERWVHRVYDECEESTYPRGGSIDEDTLLSFDYDLFIVEGYPRFPVEEFKRVAGRIARKAPLVLVVHHGSPGSFKPFAEVDWDHLVVFDERFLKGVVSPHGWGLVEKAKIIPYPYATVEAEAYRPPFGEGRDLFMSFGRQPAAEYLDYFRALEGIRRGRRIAYWIIRSNGLLPFENDWIYQYQDRPELEVIHSYLRGSDVHLLPKGETRNIVVSSTIHQTLYSGTPTIVPDTRYFEEFRTDDDGVGAVVKYRRGNIEDLTSKIEMLLDDDRVRARVAREARRIALENSEVEVARRFLKLASA